MSTPIDRQTLEQVVSIEEQGFESLVDLYMKDTRETLNRLEIAIEQQASETVRDLAHTALGASQMLGMTAVAAVLKQLEKLGARKDLTTAARLLQRCRLEVGRTQKFLQALVIEKKGTEC